MALWKRGRRWWTQTMINGVRIRQPLCPAGSTRATTKWQEAVQLEKDLIKAALAGKLGAQPLIVAEFKSPGPDSTLGAVVSEAVRADLTQSSAITLMAPSKTYHVPGLGTSIAIIPDAKLRAQFVRATAGIVAGSYQRCGLSPALRPVSLATEISMRSGLRAACNSLSSHGS